MKNNVNMNNSDISLEKKYHQATESAVSNFDLEQTLEHQCQDLREELEVLNKSKRRWQITDIILLILLIIILLFSLFITIFKVKQPINYYSAVVTAPVVELNRELIPTMTTDEMLELSKLGAYTSNCLEFYYDPIDENVITFQEGSTTYMQTKGLDFQIIGYDLDYEVTNVVEKKNAFDSVTSVAVRDFEYGLKDGSCQVARPEKNFMFWDGYSKVLLDNYMSRLTTSEVVEEAAVIVVNKDIEVNAEFIEAMLNGVCDDDYLVADVNPKSADVTDVPKNYYGLYSDDTGIYYLKSHNTGYAKEELKINVTDKIAENISAFIGEEVTVTTKVPFKADEPTTVIYLSTCNWLYDNFYIANMQNMY